MALCLLAILLAPMLLGAGGKNPMLLDTRRKRIEELSETGRARLLYKNERFLKLTAQQQDACRKLHEEIQRNPQLRDTMLKYQQWLKTLSAWQRDELRTAEDLSVRMRLVRKFKEEQAQRNRTRPSLSPGGRGSRAHGFRSGAVLNADDLAAVLEIIERRVRFSPEDRRELNALEPAQHSVRLLAMAVRRRRGPGRANLFRSPEDGLILSMIESITDERIRTILHSQNSPDSRRRILIRLIAGTVIGNWQAEMQKLFPSDEELTELFVELGPRQSENIMRLGLEEQNRRLFRIYRENNPDKFPIKRHELMRVFSLMRRGDGPPFRHNRNRTDRFEQPDHHRAPGKPAPLNRQDRGNE